MSLAHVWENGRSFWLSGEGPNGDVALSTRVRLARNLAGIPFPSRMDPATSEGMLARVREAVSGLMDAGAPVAFHLLSELTPLERQALVEKHLISPQHARQGQGALVLRGDEAVSIMVNEEDHLRLQCLFPGLQVEKAWSLALQVDEALEQRLEFAFCAQRGYLTACPTNTGTGMRASVMLHLPGLVMSNQAPTLFGALGKVGVAVRGLYGEGSDALGNLFQVSNQTTLGPSEGEIIENLMGITQQVVERERAARKKVHRERKQALEDRVWRAYGILTTARSISSREAMALLSDLRLGIDLQVLPQVEPRVFNELLVQQSPGFLQVVEGHVLPPAQRDARRATLIRQRIKESEAVRGG